MMRNLFLAVVLLVSASIYAGGYRVGLQGQRSLAMGHAGVSVVSNAELAFFNPAGLIYLENKLNISAGVSGVFSDVAWQSEQFGQYSETDSPVGTPFYLYASYKVTDWLALGLNVSTPYGSRVEWEKDWAGSHLVNNIELGAVYIQPLVSLKISDIFSIGGGPIYVTGSVNFNRNLSRTLADANGDRSNVTIDASGVNAWGWSVGAMFTPVEDLRIGFNYRSEIILDAEGGDANFDNIPTGLPFEDTPFNASLPLPAELSLGASYQVTDKWLVAFQFDRTYWSVYESLDIDFVNPNIPDSVNPRNYQNSSIYRVGVEYKALDKLALRAGYYFDESPIQEGFFAPETPRPDSNNFTAGLSFDVNDHFAIDASFLYVKSNEVNVSYDFYQENGQNVPFRGTYKNNAFIPGIGITYKL
ncbi:OmpP1/FadL family transporter [Aquimarina rhabdastrellae]